MAFKNKESYKREDFGIVRLKLVRIFMHSFKYE